MDLERYDVPDDLGVRPKLDPQDEALLQVSCPAGDARQLWRQQYNHTGIYMGSHDIHFSSRHMKQQSMPNVDAASLSWFEMAAASRCWLCMC